MRPPGEQQGAAEAAVVETERHLGAGRYAAARNSLADAARLGASRRDIERLHSSIDRGEARSKKGAKAARWLAFGLGILAYLILSVQQPPAWRVPVWAALAFLAVPATVGFTAGKIAGRGTPAPTRFRAGMSAGGWAMFWYAAITLFMLHARMNSGAPAGEVFLAGAFVTIVYSLLAGLVAGLVSAKLAFLGPGRRPA